MIQTWDPRLYSVSLDSRLGVGSRDVAEEGDSICKNLTLKTRGLFKQVRISIERAIEINTHETPMLVRNTGRLTGSHLSDRSTTAGRNESDPVHRRAVSYRR